MFSSRYSISDNKQEKIMRSDKHLIIIALYDILSTISKQFLKNQAESPIYTNNSIFATYKHFSFDILEIFVSSSFN